MLDLDFDQEQELLRQTVRDMLARHCSLDVVRQMEDDPVGYPPRCGSSSASSTSSACCYPRSTADRGCR